MSIARFIGVRIHNGLGNTGLVLIISIILMPLLLKIDKFVATILQKVWPHKRRTNHFLKN